MSRTFRTQKKSYNLYYQYWFEDLEPGSWREDYLKTEEYKYKMKSGRHYANGSKPFHNSKNRKKRAVDKRELSKELNQIH